MNIAKQDRLWRNRIFLLKYGYPLGIALPCLWILTRSLESESWRALPHAIAQVPPLNMFGAIALCCLSLWAVGRYDLVAHRHQQTGVSDRRAQFSGTIAICLSQTIGFGLISGALSRWRLLPTLSAVAALRLSAFISVSFLCSLSILTALACLIMPAPAWTLLPALMVLSLALALTVLLFWAPHLRVARLNIKMPSLIAASAIFLWTALDTLAAAGALYLLMPYDLIDLASFIPLFLIALGAAILSGTPGGLGPFELILMGGLSHVPQPELLAGIIAFRLFYYALPAVLAIIALMRPIATEPLAQPQPTPALPSSAEARVIRQNGGYCIVKNQTTLALWPTPQTLTALAVDGSGAPSLGTLHQEATRQNRIPLLYKCGAPQALQARSHRWHVLRLAQEATLDPTSFDLNSPKRRSLRRKLRSAKKAGVTTALCPCPDYAVLAQIDETWQTQNGTARGGTMGRFCRDYLSHQQVFVAAVDGAPIAFVSFHTTANEWCLDLIRTGPHTPNGTIHALILHALKEAAAQKINTLSLAAIPDFAPSLLSKLAARLGLKITAPGLCQFKNSFAPQWHPRYAAAPTRLALAIALADVARQVHAPGTIPSHTPPHEDDEQFDIAYATAS